MSRADRDSRHLLLPALRAAQRRVGWVSEGALGYASRRLSVPPAEAYGVASFYALLALEEQPADVTHVCTDLSCALQRSNRRPRRAPEPVPRPLRARSREVPHHRGPGAVRAAAARRRATASAGRRPLVVATAAANRRRCRPDITRRVRRGRWARIAGARTRARAGGGDRRGDDVAPARAWRCGVPHRA